MREENLDEVLQWSPAELERHIIEETGSVCASCAPAMRERAHQLATFAGIGRASTGQAVELLRAYNLEICTHLGAAAIEAPALDFASA